VASEWLLRFRALRAGSDFSETWANSLNSPKSSSESCVNGPHATRGRPTEAIKAIYTQHSERGPRQEQSSARVEPSVDLANQWDLQDWRDLYQERAAHREFDAGYSRADAERLAWAETENRWHMQRGERVPVDICAGCRRPISSAATLSLIDGNRVHDHPDNRCLTRHGERWRAAASKALTDMGLRPPREWNAADGSLGHSPIGGA
jgi:hypothetical protein